jgi:DNA recombination protein RmuC
VRFEEALKQLNQLSSESSTRFSEHLIEVKAKLDEVRSAAEAARELKELLWKPKLKGIAGEASLYSIVSDILPKELYETQYRFRNGTAVDLIIKIDGRIIPIDSKFPLAAFEKYLKAPDEQERLKKAKEVASAIKKHVDEISSKYINPSENTFDFALMYIPSENLFQEIVGGADFSDEALDAYFRKKNVYPISPGTFYSFLAVVSFILKNIRLEKSLSKISGSLMELESSVNQILETARVLQNHIKNSSKSVEGIISSLNDFSRKLERVTDAFEEKDADL